MSDRDVFAEVVDGLIHIVASYRRPRVAAAFRVAIVTKLEALLAQTKREQEERSAEIFSKPLNYPESALGYMRGRVAGVEEAIAALGGATGALAALTAERDAMRAVVEAAREAPKHMKGVPYFFVKYSTDEEIDAYESEINADRERLTDALAALDAETKASPISESE